MDQAELRRLENMCIQEEAPPCEAACPIHVDVRTMMAHIQQGDFTAALKTLRKKLPFPGIIGRICDQPCREVCERGNVGDAIAIAALERACADFGDPSDERPRPIPRRNSRVAVVGGGLSGLTVAFDLARKGYPVVIFEAGERLGGRLWDIPAEKLPRSVLEKEMGLIEPFEVEVRLNTTVGRDIGLAEIAAQFEAVYLAAGGQQNFGLAVDEQGRLQVDPATFATTQAGLFAGGSLLQEAYSPIVSISHGRRAATSIDRHCQNVSLTASRQNEGPYPTRLYTNLAGIEPAPVEPMTDPAAGYTRREAMAEANRCLLCECMECVKVCEYLAHFGSYPRQYLRRIYNNLSIVMGHRQANTLINSCSLCALCAEVCPEDLGMGLVCQQARRTMVADERMPPSAHEFALRDMAFSNGEHFALARHQPGAAASQSLFFPGCQLSASYPEYIGPIYDYLRQNLPEVGLMLRCCGAPAEWAGRQELFEDSLAELRAQYEELDRPQVILGCSSCHRIFRRYLPEVEIISLWELFDQAGLPASAVGYEEILAIHDPCATRYEQSLQDSVRNILVQLGCRVEELPLSREKTECCSYGGLMWLANPELAQQVVERRIAETEQDYLTYCAMCRDFFARHGKRSLHLLDLLFGDPAPDRPAPDYSQRHENRARLKRNLLKERWGETMPEQESIRLVIAEPVRKRLEQRHILTEDIQQVIQADRKLVNPETGHFLAYHRPANVTYWVEYAPAEGGGFVIHNAYSHRMEIVEGENS